MSYVTLEAEIDHGQVRVKDPEKLPETARALVTILEPVTNASTPDSSLLALEALQKHLKLGDQQAAEWMATIREARR